MRSVTNLALSVNSSQATTMATITLRAIACLSLIGLTPCQAFAQTAVIPMSQSTKAVWVANAAFNVRDRRDYGAAVLATMLNAYYHQNTNVSPADAQTFLNTVSNTLTAHPVKDSAARQTAEG